MTALTCPRCGHEAARHDDMGCFHRENGARCQCRSTEAQATLAAQRQAAAYKLLRFRITRDDFRRWSKEKRYKRRVYSQYADNQQRDALTYRQALRDLEISKRPATGNGKE